MTDGPSPAAPSGKPRANRSDMVLSVILPLAVIGLGVALSTGGASAILDLCLEALR